MADKNFLLGHGERLTKKIPPPAGGGPKTDVYSFTEANERLLPKLAHVTAAASELPAAACPHDEAVVSLVLHPAYMAKSYHPGQFLRAANLHQVGSRQCIVQPEKVTRQTEAETWETTELFVSGPRRAIKRLSTDIARWNPESKLAKELIRFEDIRFPSPAERIQPVQPDVETPLLEIALHSSADYVLDGFANYMRSLDLDAKVLEEAMTNLLTLGDLTFVPIRVPRALLKRVAQFSFLRVLREMPRLRSFQPIVRIAPGYQIGEIPKTPPIDKSLKVAIIDGGITAVAGLDHYVTNYETAGIGTANAAAIDHGTAVTSAFLFGPIIAGQSLSQPYAKVDHYRVLDGEADGQDEGYTVLRRVLPILESKKYEFINVSLGPDLPIEDTEVHPWGVAFDLHLHDGNTLATVAVGNSGELDHASGNARIQPPSDSVNVLSVGAADCRTGGWKRAPYSSIGPGRRPGYVKPDLLAFGGVPNQPFLALDAQNLSTAIPVCGTSFASPLALRTAVGVRAHFGSVMSPAAVKAMMIHCCEAGNTPRRECGWGRIPDSIDEMVLCGPGTVRIMYTGDLSAGQWLRVPIPVPAVQIQGKVTIRATMCFFSPVDPRHPANYTQSGLEITFRPHEEHLSKKGVLPKSSPFFSENKYYAYEDEYLTELERRTELHKWETVVHGERTLYGSSLNNPCFDVHYQTRQGGAAHFNREKFAYALIVTVMAPKEPEIYDRVLQRYRTQLEPLKPIIELPLTV
ncbi:MAG: S8 family peptidase [Armatimonadota bacterium]